jgi:hypothetical protein
VKADAAFVGPAHIVVLDAIPRKHPQRSIIHVNGDREFKLAGWPAKYFSHLRVKVELPGNTVKLTLCHLECINLFGHNLLLRFIVIYV